MYGCPNPVPIGAVWRIVNCRLKFSMARVWLEASSSLPMLWIACTGANTVDGGAAKPTTM